MSSGVSCEVPEWIYKGPLELGKGLLYSTFCFGALIPRIAFTTLSILSLRQETVSEKAGFEDYPERFQKNNYFSSLYHGVFTCLNPRSEFTFEPLGSRQPYDSYLSAQARKILDFARKLARKGVLLPQDHYKEEKSTTEKIEIFFKSHVFSRILYAVGTIAVVLAKTIELAAAIILGTAGLILAIPCNLSKEWSQDPLFKRLHDTVCTLFMAVNMVDDLCMGLRAFINPFQKGISTLITCHATFG